MPSQLLRKWKKTYQPLSFFSFLVLTILNYSNCSVLRGRNHFISMHLDVIKTMSTKSQILVLYLYKNFRSQILNVCFTSPVQEFNNIGEEKMKIRDDGPFFPGWRWPIIQIPLALKSFTSCEITPTKECFNIPQVSYLKFLVLGPSQWPQRVGEKGTPEINNTTRELRILGWFYINGDWKRGFLFMIGIKHVGVKLSKGLVHDDSWMWCWYNVNLLRRAIIN